MKHFLLAALILLIAALPIHAVAEAYPEIALRNTADYSKRYYENPSSIRAIGDPFILAAEGAYWCFATSSSMGFLVWRSEDLVQWEKQPLAYKLTMDNWATRDFWAPEVYQVNGKYYLFFSAFSFEHQSLRIGLAVSDQPGGPYENLKNEPLFDPGYAAIDASLFIDDDGTKYLLYSKDCSENVYAGRHESHIYGVPLKDDFSGIDGEPTLLTKPDQAWEFASGDWRWNEGAIIRKVDDIYWLFYSANFYAGKEYSVGVARAEHPLGPYEKAAEPILQYVDLDGETLVSGAGHNSFFAVGDETFTAYHTHVYPYAPSDNRQMAFDRTGFHSDGTPYINGPTLYPQLRPLKHLSLKNHGPEAAVHTDGEADLSALTDGDYGICEFSRDRAAAARRFGFQWEAPRTVDSLILYPSPGASGQGRVIFDNSMQIAIDLADIEVLPGACLRLHFDPVEVSELTFEFDEDAVSLAEILVIGSDDLNESPD